MDDFPWWRSRAFFFRLRVWSSLLWLVLAIEISCLEHTTDSNSALINDKTSSITGNRSPTSQDSSLSESDGGIDNEIREGTDNFGLYLPRHVLHHLLVVEPNILLDKLGHISTRNDSLERTFLDGAHNRAAGFLINSMSAAGMRAWRDPIGNVRGRAYATKGDVPEMIVGSHYDTVKDAGKFDGALGIISGISAVKTLMIEAAVRQNLIPLALIEKHVSESERTAENRVIDLEDILGVDSRRLTLQRPIQIVGFSDEEGVRFQTTFLGSKALSGTLVESGALNKQDKKGISVLESLREAGLANSEDEIRAMKLPKDRVSGYIEVHLEQGPVLEKEGHSIGVVSAIAGQTFLQVQFNGEQGHAGAVPMHMRRDPMAGAAAAIALIEKSCLNYLDNSTMNLMSKLWYYLKQFPPFNIFSDYWMFFHTGKSPSALVCTVGKLEVWPGASNVIPSQVNVTYDIRSQSDEERQNFVLVIKSIVGSVCKSRGLVCHVQINHEAPAVHCDDTLTRILKESSNGDDKITTAILNRTKLKDNNEDDNSKQSNFSGKNTTINYSSQLKISSGPISLVSGAGHDAIAMAESFPVGMLFVRCHNGVSHSPLEYVSSEDVGSASVALWRFLGFWTTSSEWPPRSCPG